MTPGNPVNNLSPQTCHTAELINDGESIECYVLLHGFVNMLECGQIIQ